MLSENDLITAIENATHLKSGREYQVLKFEFDNDLLVIKIARNSGSATSRLIVEFERISLLTSISTGYREAMLKPITAGFHEQKFYYVLPFVEGNTLSQILRSESDSTRVIEVVDNVLDLSWALQANTLEFPKNNQGFFSFIKQFIMAEYSAARRIIPRDTIEPSTIYIDDERHMNLGTALQELLQRKELTVLDDLFTLESYRHWNLHGGNLLINSQLQVSLIDPDTKILIQDPLFEVSRLFYTVQHDMVEYNDFVISSISPKEFFVNYTLNAQQIHNYSLLDVLTAKPQENVIGNAEYSLDLRLWLTYLCCLFRGINSNYINGENESEELRMTSKSIYLYLASTRFVNRLLEA